MKRLILILCLLLALSQGLALTSQAYFSYETGIKFQGIEKARISFEQVSSKVEGAYENIAFKNTGNIPAYLSVMIAPSKGKDFIVDDAFEDIKMDYDNEQWLYANIVSYYRYPLKPGETTNVLIQRLGYDPASKIKPHLIVNGYDASAKGYLEENHLIIFDGEMIDKIDDK